MSSLQIAEPPVNKAPPFDWRSILPVHPAAELFPLMKETDPAGFKGLVEDIRVQGLSTPLAMWTDVESGEKFLIDGRNRLDALAELGCLGLNDKGELGWRVCDKWLDFKNLEIIGGDPYEIVLSFNVHRRHLNAEQKDDLIAAVLKAKTELSNRQIGALTKTDKKKVQAVRTKMEATGEIPPVEKTIGKDKKARKKPARKPVKTKAKDKTETETKTETKTKAADPEASAEPIDGEKIIELAGQARALLKHVIPSNVESVKALLTKICRLCAKPSLKIIRTPEEKKPTLDQKLLPKALGLGNLH